MPNPTSMTARPMWTRILYMLLFALVFQLVELLMLLVVLVQLFTRLFSGDTFAELRTLGDGLAGYARDILRFMMFSTDELPYPFAARRAESFQRREGPVDPAVSG